MQAVVAVGVFLAAPRVRITLFSASPVAWGLFTVVWLLLITNAFNLLDNMDGLSSGVALVATGILVIGALATGQFFVALFLFAFGGGDGRILPEELPAGSDLRWKCGRVLPGVLPRRQRGGIHVL